MITGKQSQGALGILMLDNPGEVRGVAGRAIPLASTRRVMWATVEAGSLRRGKYPFHPADLLVAVGILAALAPNQTERK